MHAKHNVETIKRTVKLLKEYESQKVLCAVEFIDSKHLEHIPMEVSTMFFNLIKHKMFFDKLLDHFLEQYQLKRTSKWILESLLYLLIFVLSKDNYDEIKCAFLKIQYKFPLKIVQFLIQNENQMLCARAGCKYFDKDYILSNIIHPLLDNEKLLKVMEKDLSCEFNERTAVLPKKLTIPVTPTVFRKKILPQTPINSRISESNFQATEVPNYRGQNEKLRRSFVKKKDENWNKALKLLEEAQKCPFKCAFPSKEKYTHTVVEKHIFKSKSVPKFKSDVPIKKTNTCLMREAAVLVKNRECEMKKLEELLGGAFDYSKIDAIEGEIRKCREQQHLQDIERKHLEGLLTFEEAQLARKKILEVNQKNREKFKEEQVKVMQEIYDWKEKERIKIRKLVEKCQDIDKSAKQAGKKLLEEKRLKAKLVDYESKRLLQEIQQEREQQLAEKVKLIQELRVLHQLRLLNVKQFDPAECPNFGFLCEMSIAELRERLNLLKVEMQEELEERKKSIAEERNRKTNLMYSIKEFLVKTRTSRPKTVTNTPLKLEETSDILALRQKLYQARKMNGIKY